MFLFSPLSPPPLLRSLLAARASWIAMSRAAWAPPWLLGCCAESPRYPLARNRTSFLFHPCLLFLLDLFDIRLWADLAVQRASTSCARHGASRADPGAMAAARGRGLDSVVRRGCVARQGGQRSLLNDVLHGGPTQVHTPRGALPVCPLTPSLHGQDARHMTGCWRRRWPSDQAHVVVLAGGLD